MNKQTKKKEKNLLNEFHKESWAPPEPPSDFADRVLESLYPIKTVEVQNLPKKTKSRFFSLACAVGFSILLSFSLGVFFSPELLSLWRQDKGVLDNTQIHAVEQNTSQSKALATEGEKFAMKAKTTATWAMGSVLAVVSPYMFSSDASGATTTPDLNKMEQFCTEIMRSCIVKNDQEMSCEKIIRFCEDNGVSHKKTHSKKSESKESESKNSFQKETKDDFDPLDALLDGSDRLDKETRKELLKAQKDLEDAYGEIESALNDPRLDKETRKKFLEAQKLFKKEFKKHKKNTDIFEFGENSFQKESSLFSGNEKSIKKALRELEKQLENENLDEESRAQIEKAYEVLHALQHESEVSEEVYEFFIEQGKEGRKHHHSKKHQKTIEAYKKALQNPKLSAKKRKALEKAFEQSVLQEALEGYPGPWPPALLHEHDVPTPPMPPNFEGMHPFEKAKPMKPHKAPKIPGHKSINPFEKVKPMKPPKAPKAPKVEPFDPWATTPFGGVHNVPEAPEVAEIPFPDDTFKGFVIPEIEIDIESLQGLSEEEIEEVLEDIFERYEEQLEKQLEFLERDTEKQVEIIEREVELKLKGLEKELRKLQKQKRRERKRERKRNQR